MTQPSSLFDTVAQALVDFGREAFSRGWVPATSGNFSHRLGEDEIAITVSGRHKGFLDVDDIMRVDYAGQSLDGKRPSAETLLHTGLYSQFDTIGAVLHTHSVNATVLSLHSGDGLVLDGYEVLKAFNGIDSHETRLHIPVFANDQDIPRLAQQVNAYLAGHPQLPGYLIAGHGLYTWGDTLADTLRHLEAFEFLFQCELETRRLKA